MAKPRAGKPKTPPPRAARDAPACPIVGIGASAGGLEAMQDLFAALGHETGMAYVVVQHLAPTHPSLLSEILARHTNMPVRQVTQGTRVEPDHVYVIPPDRELGVEEGKLVLGRRPPGHDRFLPIDHFLRSLAQDCAGTAIGVVLSGSSSDGVQGLRAIKCSGGITFAQDEASAKYPEMPRHAVASGAVDLVMPPAAIAHELTRLRQHAFVLQPAVDDGSPRGVQASTVENILQTLRAATGADFTYYKQSTIQRRILRRMALARIERLEDYAKLLRESRAEVESLYRDVLINVTSFFRDPEIFKAFEQRVLPDLLGGRPPGQRVRMWVPGCSTGEEVYSLAICALEALGAEHDLDAEPVLQIFGTDLSDTVVDQARLGRYPAGIEADVPAPLLERWFTRTSDGYQVAKRVRDACVFAKHNLLRDPPFSRIDVLSCRNVLIYFGAVLQRKAVALFHYALNPGGILLLGASEHVTGFGELFAPLDKAHRIFTKNAVPGRVTLGMASDVTGTASRRAPQVAPLKETESSGLDIQREADQLLLTRFAPAGVVVDEGWEILQFRGRTGPYLESRPGSASFNLLKMAREGLVADLRTLLLRARKGGRAVRKSEIRLRTDEGRLLRVELEVVPFHPRQSKLPLYLVLFRDGESADVPAPRKGPAPAPRKGKGKGKREKKESAEEELAATKEYLQTIIEEQEATNEELMSANEEILSSNEELQSTNEELETAKEELQSANEELRTVNDELQDRNAQLGLLNDDLNHLLATIHIPMVILDADLRLRRATPLGAQLLNLIPGDVGRKVTDVRPNIDIPDLAGIVRDVLANLETRELEVRDPQGRSWLMQVRARKSSAQKIDGVVITWIDMQATRQQATKDARNLAFVLLESVQLPAAVLGPDLRIERGNLAWTHRFGLGPRDGPLTWADEPFSAALRGIFTDGKPLAGVRVKVPTAQAGPRSATFSAALLPAGEIGAVSLLLCLESENGQRG